jgi:DNA adenine methylase
MPQQPLAEVFGFPTHNQSAEARRHRKLEHLPIINVASVPQRSPFRYPGGKTWLVPYVRAWLKNLSYQPELFIEPFAGGGIISLTTGFEQLASKVIMVELDAAVASVWQTILGGEVHYLIDKIQSFQISIDSVQAALATPGQAIWEIAFQTILKNRTFHGGILAPGSSMMKQGENGKGIASRWYAATLCERIRDIADQKHIFEFIQGDGIKLAQRYKDHTAAVFYLDPPYTAGKLGKKAGKRLYTHHQLDHEQLFEVAASLKGDVLMSYEDTQEVRLLAKKHHFDVCTIPMKNTHHSHMNELLIAKSLSWLQSLQPPVQTSLWMH